MDDKFRKELTDLINKHSLENYSNTADFILADYIIGCLQVYNDVVSQRSKNNFCRCASKWIKEVKKP